ncbi:MAG: DUF4270 family protein [Bacteroidota bacterium]|nr:DUF4270 family protein [Bacteroidota bacterium]
MIVFLSRRWGWLLILTACLLIQSCTRKDIQFGDNTENSYTGISFIDTVGVQLSTVVTDSFPTNGATSFLAGKYKDPYLGKVFTKSFFQMTIPATPPSIPATAQYDSFAFFFHPNNYYYGDTSKPQTFYVNELSQVIAYSYNSKLYNTTDVPVKPVPLGYATMKIKPSSADSIEIRLNDTKGAELFAKLQQSSTDVTNNDNFQNYFKGISLTTGINDTAAVFGFNGTMIMRVYYHTTIPYPASQYVDFTKLANDYSFNQVLTDRTGTGITSGSTGITEINSSQTNNLAFMQPGTGLYLKMIFPSLHSIVGSGKLVKLLKAELMIRPAYLSFDRYKYRLPSPIYLSQTDESNVVGSPVPDSTGSGIGYATPVIDDLYGQDNYYRFNVTPYINRLLTTTGSENQGFFVMRDVSASSMNVDRLVLNNSFHGNQSSRLLLYVVIINQ